MKNLLKNFNTLQKIIFDVYMNKARIVSEAVDDNYNRPPQKKKFQIKK